MSDAQCRECAESHPWDENPHNLTDERVQAFRAARDAFVAAQEAKTMRDRGGYAEIQDDPWHDELTRDRHYREQSYNALNNDDDCSTGRRIREAQKVLARHPMSETFHRILTELGALHDKKQADYGRDDDPFANVRASEEWGVTPWVGAMVRLHDKVRRLQKAAKGGTLSNEGVIDSLNDIAVYAVIARVLYETDPDRVPF